MKGHVAMSARISAVALGASAAAAVLLAGCSGSGHAGTAGNLVPDSVARQQVRQTGPFARPLSLLDLLPPDRTAPSQSLVFETGFQPDGAQRLAVTEYGPPSSGASQFNIYAVPDKKNVAPTCTTTTYAGLNSLGVDSKHTVWLPDGATDTVVTLPEGSCDAGTFTLNEPNGQPADVAFGKKDTVFISDIAGNNSTAGSISVYPKGKTSPTSSLTNPNVFLSFGIAADKAGDVFQTYESSASAFGILEFAGGAGSGSAVTVKGISVPIGITFDKTQRLLVADAGLNDVLVYAPPYNGKSPAVTIALKGSPVIAKLDAANKNLYVTDRTNGTVDVYSYPAGKYEYSISNGLSASDDPTGVAVDPASTE